MNPCDLGTFQREILFGDIQLLFIRGLKNWLFLKSRCYVNINFKEHNAYQLVKSDLTLCNLNLKDFDYAYFIRAALREAKY